MKLRIVWHPESRNSSVISQKRDLDTNWPTGLVPDVGNVIQVQIPTNIDLVSVDGIVTSVTWVKEYGEIIPVLEVWSR